MTGGWIVRRWDLTTDARRFGIERVAYPFFVVGVNQYENGRDFSWMIPSESIWNPNYDWSNATRMGEQPMSRLFALRSRWFCPLCDKRTIYPVRQFPASRRCQNCGTTFDLTENDWNIVAMYVDEHGHPHDFIIAESPDEREQS